MAKATYTAKDITVLEGLEPVRLRPGMYIGSTGARGLHHLVYEVVDNAVDEALAGRADTIDVTIHPDDSVTVSDNGSGIPVDVMPEQGLPALTVVLTKLHAGGKFGGEGYKVSGGLHGVGVSVVNALSEWLTVEVHRDGKIFRQEFARGDATTDLKKEGVAKDTGTTITFLPDGDDLRGDRVVDRHPRTAPARDRVPDEGAANRPLRRALGRREARVPLRGRDPRLRLLRQPVEGPGPQGNRLLRGRQRRGPGRARDAVEQLLPGVGLLVREQHQHHRGRHAPLRLQGRPDAHAQRLRPRKGPAQGEGGQPRGRGRARGARGGALGEAPRPAVRGADEDEARQPLGARARRADRQPAARRVPRGEPDRGAADHRQGDLGGAGAAGRAQGARADAAQERARELLAAGQARGLPDQRSRPPRSSSSSRATRPAAPPWTRATEPSRRSCRCAAR